jgi:hypothetical protein
MPLNPRKVFDTLDEAVAYVRVVEAEEQMRQAQRNAAHERITILNAINQE